MIEVFTGPGCVECAAAKQLLEQHGLVFVELDVSQAEHRAAFAERLPRVRSIPQLFVDGDHLGGLADLRRALSRADPRLM